MTDQLRRLLGESRVVALLGPRQAGKSTLARRIAGEQPGGDYVSLDTAQARSHAQSDPADFLASYGRPLVIDEIQRAPDLLLEIKAVVDSDTTPGQFLLTGSANLRRIPWIADALPGRIDYFNLWPFTQGEIEGNPEDLLTRLFANDIPRITDAPVGRRQYASRLVRGGFPPILDRSPEGRISFLSSYTGSIIDRDLGDAAAVRDPDAVKRIMDLVAARSSALANFDGLARDAGINAKTAKGYVETLERLFLLRVRPAWHRNLSKRHIKSPKIYVADTGLLSVLIGVDEDRSWQDPGISGAITETFVASELERQASWHPEALSFWHFREDDREVDVVIERPNGDVIGIEVKAGATVSERDFRGLRHLKSRLGAQMRVGIIFHAGERSRRFGEGFWALPLEALWHRDLALPS